MTNDYWQNFEEGCFYHIYNHAASDKNVFNNENDYIDFLTKHYKYLSCVFDTLAYCLMPNHYHFVVKVKSLDAILQETKKETSKKCISLHKGETDINNFILDQYRRYLSSFVLAYNTRNKIRGQLFLKRFKRVSLDEDKLLYMICYVHHNPIHHGFTKDYNSWKYSSYKKCLKEACNDEFSKSHIEFKLHKEDNS